MLFLFRSAPEVEKRIHSKLFRKFWRSRGTKEPAYITVIILTIMFMFYGHQYHHHNCDHMGQVIEVNGINVEGQTPNHVLNILREAEHTITFKLIPNVGQ